MAQNYNWIMEKLLSEIEKKNKNLEIYERWMNFRIQGGNIYHFFLQNGFRNVAIYGVGYLGRNLCNELAQSEIKVVYLIDRNKSAVYETYPIYTLQDKLPETDVIVVTAIKSFNEIAEMLEEKINCPLLSLEDIIP